MPNLKKTLISDYDAQIIFNFRYCLNKNFEDFSFENLKQFLNKIVIKFSKQSKKDLLSESRIRQKPATDKRFHGFVPNEYLKLKNAKQLSKIWDFKIKMRGKERLWGDFDGNCFYVFFFDKDHEWWPVKF